MIGRGCGGTLEEKVRKHLVIELTQWRAVVTHWEKEHVRFVVSERSSYCFVHLERLSVYLHVLPSIMCFLDSPLSVSALMGQTQTSDELHHLSVCRCICVCCISILFSYQFTFRSSKIHIFIYFILMYSRFTDESSVFSTFLVFLNV